MQTLEKLPYTVNTGFIPSNYQNIGNALGNVECPAGDRSPNPVGQCRKWSYTMPQNATDMYNYIGVGYVRMFDAGYTHPPVCIADGVKNVNFYAKGAAGGEKITVTAQGAAEIEFTLTNAWKLYQIPMDGVLYNTDASGVELGFFWKLVAPTGGTIAPATFSIDGIQYVGDSGTGGAGGAGGAGGSGGSSAGAGGAKAGSGGTGG